MKVISNQSDAWSKSGLNSISQNHKVNMVIEDTNMIICVGQGVGLCNHMLNLGMG